MWDMVVDQQMNMKIPTIPRIIPGRRLMIVQQTSYRKGIKMARNLFQFVPVKLKLKVPIQNYFTKMICQCQ